MMQRTVNIAVSEPSPIIYEGIISILNGTGQSVRFYKANNLEELKQLYLDKSINLFIVNPVFLQNQIKVFFNLKKNSGEARWIGLIYNYFDQELLNVFDDLISINDSAEEVTAKINSNLDQKRVQSESLSERENDVLKLLVSGMSNKEIADSLNLSTHTVITHRKNISQKTGIKSVSGLTIYAVVNHLITIEP